MNSIAKDAGSLARGHSPEGRSRSAAWAPIGGVLSTVLIVSGCTAGVDGAGHGPGGKADDGSSAVVQELSRPDFADDPAEFEHRSKLLIPMESVATQDELDAGNVFDFCPDADGLSLTNAKWLAFMAGNQYAHFGYLAPTLADLGFGRTGDALWGACARDLQAIRYLEREDEERIRRGEDPVVPADTADFEEFLTADFHTQIGNRFGICIREFYEQEYAAKGIDRPESFSALFEQWLIQGVSENNDLQFFSAGELEVPWRGGLMRFEAGSTQVFWAKHQTLPLVVISFRGTEVREGQLWADVTSDLAAWQRDFDIDETSWGARVDRNAKDWGDVHTGFFKAFESVRPQLAAKLAELRDDHAGDEPLRIWVTGHSLGAALATFMSATILQDMDTAEANGEQLPYRLEGLYNFGSPRVGNEAFVERFNEVADKYGVSLYRFRHGQDVVTAIPSVFGRWIFGNGWQHVETTVYLANDDMQIGINVSDLPRAISATDHVMENYFREIDERSQEPMNAEYLRCGAATVEQDDEKR